MNQEKIIDSFREYLFEKKFTKSSVNGYVFGLINFLNFLKNNKLEFERFDNQDILNYKTSLKCSEQTINVRLSSVKKYCEYLKLQRGVIVDFNVSFAKTANKKSINIINRFDEIIKNIKLNQNNELTSLRDQLIFKFLYYLGLRVIDLVKIRKHDIGENVLAIWHDPRNSDTIFHIKRLGINI